MRAAADRGGPAGHAPHRRGTGGSTALVATFGQYSAGSSPIGGARPCRWLPRRGGSALAIACLIAGAWLTGSGLWIHAKAELAQLLLQQAWQYTQTTGEPLRPWPWADTRPIARLSVPDRGIDLFVLAGATGRTLAFGPGHHDGSALPGGPGNAVLSAHRDTHFRFLRELAIGDVLLLEVPDGSTTRYRVRDLAVIDHRALLLPRADDQRMLTLVTCYPFDAAVPGGSQRFVAVATAE